MGAGSSAAAMPPSTPSSADSSASKSRCRCFPFAGRAKHVVVVEEPQVVSSEDATDECRFFCPLCMLFYDKMLKASCCGQYICDTCAIAFLKGKSIDCDSAALLGRLPPTECPYCTDTGLKFEQVHASELARNYEDSPAVAQKLASRVPKQEPGAPSPLKSGDTYEDMKRKMTFFPDGDSTAETPDKGGATNPGAAASARMDVSGGDLRSALESSLRMPPVPESPGQTSRSGSTPTSSAPASPGSVTRSPMPQMVVEEEVPPPPATPQAGDGEAGGDGQGEEEAGGDNSSVLSSVGSPVGDEVVSIPGTVSEGPVVVEEVGVDGAEGGDSEGRAEMDRSCPVGLANALAAAAEDPAGGGEAGADDQPQPQGDGEGSPGAQPSAQP